MASSGISDVSGGQERIQIPLQDIAEKDVQALLTTFRQYRSQCTFHPSYVQHLANSALRDQSSLQLDNLDTLLNQSAYGCDCSRSLKGQADDGVDADVNRLCSQTSVVCECVAEHGNFAESHEADGQHQVLHLDAVPARHVLFECTELCRCHANADGTDGPRCANARVRDGLRVPLIVKPALVPSSASGLSSQEGQGLGVFATRPLPKGTFVCEYAGELISPSEARRRWTTQAETGQGNYILSVREQAYEAASSAESHTTEDVKTASSSGADPTDIRIDIDPTCCGNVARFINHLCPPLTNLVMLPVRCDGPLVLTNSSHSGSERRLGLMRLLDYLDLNGDSESPGSQGVDHSTEDHLTALAVLSAPPRAALYTSRDIKVGEQLGFNYYDASGASRAALQADVRPQGPPTRHRAAGNDDSESDAPGTGPAIPVQRTPCLCSSPACRGWLPFDAL
ncbi:unnamed protein product [Tilletia controversa]|nr:hypothetical protein CF328_g1331 [Tilletia controversa]CAD6923519.1 unnamed protein product [Tilletia controversa]CAD6926951.1 unnamed protein product [Tilletia controversa]CAD6954786.1 unnamed protein product [Tilletia controversa]CAD6981005.1 unnamed protein product [Tilletia controversa]